MAHAGDHITFLTAESIQIKLKRNKRLILIAVLQIIKPNQNHYLKIGLVIAILLAISIIGILAVSPYGLNASGNIKIHAYDTTGGGSASLAGVEVHIQAVGAPSLKCDGRLLTDRVTGAKNISSKLTGSDGMVTFKNCDPGPKRLSQYTILSYTKDGYVPSAGKSLSEKTTEGAPRSQFLLRRGQTTHLSIYLQNVSICQAKSSCTAVPAPPGAVTPSSLRTPSTPGVTPPAASSVTPPSSNATPR